MEAPAPAHATAEAGPLDASAAAPERDPGAGSIAAGAEQPLLLVTTVSISGDVSDRIELRLGDCPLVQAHRIFKKKRLPVPAPLPCNSLYPVFPPDAAQQLACCPCSLRTGTKPRISKCARALQPCLPSAQE